MGSRSLLPWVEELLQKGYNLQHEGVKEAVESLSREFESIEVALQEVAELPPNQLDEQDKLWASELRELWYDIAAVLDTFLVRAEVNPAPTRGHRNKVGYWYKKHRTRSHIDDKIKELKKLANEVATRRARYRVDGVAATPPATAVDPFLLALHTRATALVGLSKPKNEILKKLKENAIVSIYGVGGLGKTTVANQVYQSKQLDGFDCRAFVSVGRHPEITQVYGTMLREFDSHKYMRVNMSTWDVNQHIEELRQFLQYKRYFIVIDDIWSKSVWDSIKIALTDGNSNHGSRIITTTRNLDLARQLGHVYELQHLSDDNSKKLFYRRVVGGGHPDNQLVEVSGKLLKKCDGVPLAIITVASLLATKPRGDWPRVYDSLGFGQEDNSDMDNMRKILSFSYYDLPCSIRNCLLYLTVSRGYPIDKDSVIWMWIAEGFVRKENGERLFETGERYFNQLINRCLIQPLEVPLSRQITGCRVHDVVLDLIHHLSNEENFITVSQNEQYTSSQHKVHRLCINGRTVEDIPEVPQVRSFYLSHCLIQMMLPLLSFQVLRALHLDGCSFMESYDLKHLGSLVHLRHLGLQYTPIRELPKEIGDLRFLLSLIVRDTGIEELPASVCQLGQLVHLIVSGNVRLPDEIGKLTSLEYLVFSCVGGCTILMEEVGKLTELRMLTIELHESEESSEKALVGSLCKLHKLQHLGVDCSPFRNDTWESWVPPPELRRLFFDAGMQFPKIPKWINSDLFPNLCFLSLVVFDLHPDDIYIFNTLPQLTGLRLSAIRICGELCYSVRLAASDYFKNLISFGFNNCITYERDKHGVGSMQNLEILDIIVHVREEKRINPDFVFGLESLASLASIAVKIDCYKAKVWEVEEVEAALRREVEAHSNHPTLAMVRLGGDTMIFGEEKPESGDDINHHDDDEVLQEMFGNIPILDEKDRRWRTSFLKDHRRDQRKIMDIKCQSERGKAMLDAQKIYKRSLDILISEFNSFGGQRGLQIVFDSRCKGIGISVWSAKQSNYDIVNRSSLWMWPMLEEVGVLLDCKEAKVWEVEEMEAMFTHLVGIHTNRPSLRLVRMNEDTMVTSNQDDDERRLLPLRLKNRRVHGLQHHMAEMKSSELPRTMLLKTCNATREMVSLAAENEDITNDKEKSEQLCLVTQRVIELQSEAGKLYFSQESKDLVFAKMNNISEELSCFMESYGHNPILSHKEIEELQMIKSREQEQRIAALQREMVELQSSHEFDGYKVVHALSLYTSLGDTGFTWGYDIPYKGEGVYVRRAKDVNGEYGSFLWFWPKLEELVVVLDCADARVWEVEETEAAYKHIVDIHASRPNLRMLRINEEKMISSDQDDVEQMLLLLRLKYRRVHAMQRDMAEVMSLEYPSAGLLQMCNAVREMASLAAENEDIMNDQEEAEKLYLETQLVIELQRRAIELNFIQQPLDAMRSRTGIIMKDLEPFILAYSDKASISQDEQKVLFRSTGILRSWSILQRGELRGLFTEACARLEQVARDIFIPHGWPLDLRIAAP